MYVIRCKSFVSEGKLRDEPLDTYYRKGSGFFTI